MSLSDRWAVNLEMWWPELEPLERVAAAAGAGFGLAEIWYWPNWEVAELGAALTEHGVSLTQIGGWDFEPRLHEREHRAAFRDGIAAAIETARALGAPRINLNGPYLRPGEDPAEVRAGVVDAIGSVVDLAEDAGVVLMVEPMNLRVDHPGYCLPTSADVVEVCRAIGSPALGVNWDFYHLQISEGDLSGHLAEGIEQVAYLQVADHPGRHEPGTGEIDYAFVLARSAAFGYDGPIGLECVPRDGAARAVERLAGIEARIERVEQELSDGGAGHP